MPFLRGLAVAALLLCGIVRGIVAQDVDPDDVARVLERGACQTQLPGEGTSHGGRREAAPTRRGERSGAPGRSSTGWGGGILVAPGVAVVLLWVVVGVAVLLLVAAVARSWRGRREPARPVAKLRAASVPRPASSPEPLADHERLAAAGEFGAAVHALLQHAFVAFGARVGGLPVHATGRDVLRLARRQAAATEPLAHLVAAVERVHFGGRPADRGQYETSAAHLRQWEVACRQPK
jgi:hypothetical protein